jgi:hypothetical protein
MQRKPSKNTRVPNADEKAFMRWVKEHDCCICGNPGPSIVDHMEGSTFRHNKVLIGMWALLPYCYEHDLVKTRGSHKSHFNTFGKTQAEIWEWVIFEYENETYKTAPDDVKAAIKDWGR